jgi:hypothetical protein
MQNRLMMFLINFIPQKSTMRIFCVLFFKWKVNQSKKKIFAAYFFYCLLYFLILGQSHQSFFFMKNWILLNNAFYFPFFCFNHVWFMIYYNKCRKQCKIEKKKCIWDKTNGNCQIKIKFFFGKFFQVFFYL